MKKPIRTTTGLVVIRADYNQALGKWYCELSDEDGIYSNHAWLYETHLIFEEEETPLDKQTGGTHYKQYPIQPIEYCQRNNLNYCESNVIKYVTRHKDKNGIEDLRKAIHCIELLIELEYNNEA